MGYDISKTTPPSDSFMSKIDKTAIEVKAKEKYRLTNWSAYNAGLETRGHFELVALRRVGSRVVSSGPAAKRRAIYLCARLHSTAINLESEV